MSGATVVAVGECERLTAEDWGLVSESTFDSMGEEGEVGVLVLRN